MTYDVFVFIFGSVIGSFLNVCIYRMPKEISISKPARSYCPHCRKTIPWHLNIPLISWLALGGKCKFCGAKIAFRYFFVELVTALVFVYLWELSGGVPILFLVRAIFVSFIIIIVVTDFEETFIPDLITIPGMVLGLVFSLFPNVLFQQEMWYYRAAESLAGMAVGYGIMWATGILGNMMFKKDSMGGGDLKLMAMMGAWIGWLKTFYVFLFAPFIALPFALWYRVAKKDEHVPFGPFLAFWGTAFFLYGEQLTKLILKFY